MRPGPTSCEKCRIHEIVLRRRARAVRIARAVRYLRDAITERNLSEAARCRGESEVAAFFRVRMRRKALAFKDTAWLS